MLTNVFGSPRTTLAGLAALLVGVLGSNLVPTIVAYFGAQPSIGWQFVGYIIGAVVPALMVDAKKKLDDAAKV